MTNIIVFAACVSIGFLGGLFVKNRLKRKYVLYSDLHSFAKSVEEGIQNCLSTVSQVYEKAKDSFGEQFKETFENVFVEGKPYATDNSVSAFFSGIQSVNSQSAKKCAAYYCSEFLLKQNEFEKEYKTKGDVALKLGALFGAAVGLLLV